MLLPESKRADCMHINMQMNISTEFWAQLGQSSLQLRLMKGRAKPDKRAETEVSQKATI